MELTIDQALQQGIAAHKEGKVQKAERLYRSILSSQPQHPDVNHNLGVLAVGVGQVDAALPHFKAALEANPKQEQFWLSYIDALIKLGQMDNARQVLNQGKIAGLKSGKLDQLEAQLGKSVSSISSVIKTTNPSQEQLDDLISLYNQRNLQEALVQGNTLAQKFPNSHTLLNILGAVYSGLGRHEEAVAGYNKAIELKPDYAETYYNLGATLKELSKHEEAVVSYNKAIELRPYFAEAYNNLGSALNKLGDYEKAVTSYNKAIELKPDYAETYYNLGSVFHELERYEESIARLTKAIELKPDYVEAYNNLGNSLNKLDRHEEAIASYNKVIELKPDFAGAYSNKNLVFNYASSWSTAFVFEQHLKFEKQFGGLEVRTSLNKVVNEDSKKRLRIGYVSPDFRTHSVAYFFEPLLENHTSTTVETFCYYNGTKIDDTTRRLTEYSDHWRSVVGVSDADVVELIKNDKIDILVDLAGHTANNRLLVFAQKPAPIQVTWLGYPNTTGLQAIDYRFTDIIADPIGEADKLHSEKLIRLGNGFQCYKGNKNASIKTQSPSHRRGYITFGSFNDLAKSTPEVIKAWSMILKALPTSHLLLKAKQLEYSKDHYLDLFRQEGIAQNRIELHARLANPNDHLALYNSIDICLDPFPFNGATTTCEALWMGVPVVTLAGDRHVGRVGASLLTNVGLTNFIAQDIDGYIETAIKMASDTDYLQSTRQGLRERMQHSPLCDGRSFANEVENAYQKMWAKHIKF